jgi:hypothetical protein
MSAKKEQRWLTLEAHDRLRGEPIPMLAQRENGAAAQTQREGQRVVPMPGGSDRDPRQRPTAGVSGQMNLAGQQAGGAAQRLPAGTPSAPLVIDPPPV